MHNLGQISRAVIAARPARSVQFSAFCFLLFQSVATAAVQVIGVQHQPDYYYPEFNCYWNASAYPGPCRTPILGTTVHVYVKNTGPGSITLNDANLITASTTYSLKTIIKKSTSTTINPKEQNSIYFYWDFPP